MDLTSIIVDIRTKSVYRNGEHYGIRRDYNSYAFDESEILDALISYMVMNRRIDIAECNDITISGIEVE